MINSAAVLGLGSMGMGIARALVERGWRVDGCDIRPEARAAFSAYGGTVHAKEALAVEGQPVVISVVVNADQAEELLFGAGNVANSMPKGSLFISCATMAPARAESIGAKTDRAGLLYLDAPISGGAVKAAAGELTVMASGTSAAFDAAAPVLEAIASRVFRVGERPGQAAAMKMVNQLLAGVHIAAASEAIVFAAKLGLDLSNVYEVITASAGNSWMFENRIPHVLSGDYRPLSSVEIFVKDLGIINDMSRELRFASPIAAVALQMYLAAAGSGHGFEDDSAVAKVYAALSDVTLPGKKGLMRAEIFRPLMTLSSSCSSRPFTDHEGHRAVAGARSRGTRETNSRCMRVLLAKGHPFFGLPFAAASV
jgi:putative dehydrogenase